MFPARAGMKLAEEVVARAGAWIDGLFQDQKYTKVYSSIK
jgi:hypothetical protein